MPTPLYDSLRALADSAPLRLDMPGHHGMPLPGAFSAWPSAIDFTENGATGDLFGDGPDAIQAAEQLWAGRFGFDSCLFLTGGSTQGAHAGLALLAGRGSAIALDRGSHRSAYHALALLSLTPHFLTRPWLAEEGVTGPVLPETVEEALTRRPEIKTVCITSPTYYGVLSDIPALAAVCHAHGAALMVDGAHGAHLPFLGYTGYRAADVVVMSAHKTLPAPGQTALLFANGFGLSELQRWGAVYGTSSPSYVLMAALDAVRDYMEGAGTARYRETARLVETLRRRWPALTERDGLSLDPTRLTLSSPDGFALADALRERGVYPEMADRGHVVSILTCADGAPEAERLDRALAQTRLTGPGAPCPPPPEPPEAALSPREALFAPRETIPLARSAGRIAACQIAPYPPGVPVVAPGERIEKKHLAYLREIGYNSGSVQTVR
ncbi:MAG: aminotransferase class V-fold PLP-dependent enzyme [Clostridiales bacterium]|nr:aminotransferase class V-fold PLP-dependent enzyme [Clostridiales bacterium]